MNTSNLNLEYDTLFNICQNNIENIDDIKTQYISLLSFLTETPNITTSQFLYQINEISKMGEIFICYIYNISSTPFNISNAYFNYYIKIILIYYK